MSIFRPPLHAAADVLDLTVEVAGALALVVGMAIAALSPLSWHRIPGPIRPS
jgi:hypothetical protein